MPLKVMYIDDEELLCECFHDEFEDADIEIQTFTDAKKAVKTAATSAPDLVFIDYRMPEESGDQIAPRFPATSKIYLITGELETQLKFKFEAVLKKPFDFELIKSILESAKRTKSK